MTTLRDKLPDYRNRYYRLKRKEAKSNFLIAPRCQTVTLDIILYIQYTYYYTTQKQGVTYA